MTLVEIQTLETNGCLPYNFGGTKQWFVIEIGAFYLHFVLIMVSLTLAHFYQIVYSDGSRFDKMDSEIVERLTNHKDLIIINPSSAKDIE